MNTSICQADGIPNCKSTFNLTIAEVILVKAKTFNKIS